MSRADEPARKRQQLFETSRPKNPKNNLMDPTIGFENVQLLIDTARQRGLEVIIGTPVDDAYLDTMASIMEIRFPDGLRAYFTSVGFLQVEDLTVAGFTRTKSGAKDTFPTIHDEDRAPGEGFLPVYGRSIDSYVWVCCKPGSNFGRVYSSAEDNYVAPDFLTWLHDKLGLLLDSYEEGAGP